MNEKLHKTIPIYKPFLSDLSLMFAHDAINSGWVSSIGDYLDRASMALCEKAESKYSVLMNNGTSATHVAAIILRRIHPNIKRVIVPSSCYVAAYNALLYNGYDWSLEPVDVDIDTWNMILPRDVDEYTAVMAVHNLGNVMDLSCLNCPIIEDSCEALMGVTKQTQSLCSSTSFFGNKNITSGEGGALLTEDEHVYNLALKLRGQGQTKVRYVHDELGYNYRMTNIQAAILLGQLSQWEEIKSAKRRLFDRYRDSFSGVANIFPQKIDMCHSNWMFGIRICNGLSYQRKLELFNSRGIDVRPMFYPIYRHSHLRHICSDEDAFPNAKSLSDDVVILPSHPSLSDEEINRIIAASKAISRLDS